MRREDIDVWCDKFQPQMKDEDAFRFYETYGEDWETVKNTPVEYVWTLIEADNNKQYVCTGIHWVNRLNYFICKNPWKENQRDYLYWNGK